MGGVLQLKVSLLLLIVRDGGLDANEQEKQFVCEDAYVDSPSNLGAI